MPVVGGEGSMGAITKRLRWFGAGAVVALLFDPARGRARRARLRGQTAAVLRRVERRTQRRSRYVSHWGRGKVSRLSRRPHDEPADDRTLVDKVRSEVMGHIGAVAHSLTIDAQLGVVTVRGSGVDDAAVIELERRLRCVRGVRDVRILVHPEGTPAPNKAAALELRQ
jgi:hypothetical protein